MTRIWKRAALFLCLAPAAVAAQGAMPFLEYEDFRITNIDPLCRVHEGVAITADVNDMQNSSFVLRVKFLEDMSKAPFGFTFISARRVDEATKIRLHKLRGDMMALLDDECAKPSGLRSAMRPAPRYNAG